MLYYDHAVNEGGGVSILYGNPNGGLPDTTDVQTVSYNGAWNPGETGQLMDLSGDGLPELVVLESLTLSSRDQHIRVYMGEPGDDLKDLYGDGSDLWARFPTPIVLHDGWGGFLDRVYDLGDFNQDGYRDIYAYHHPYFLGYGAGQLLDSLIDGYYRFDGVRPASFVNLGDIDGSGVGTIGVGYNSGIRYLQWGDSIRPTGVPRLFRHEPGVVQCKSTVSVEREREMQGTMSGLAVQVTPNPGSGTFRIAWQADVSHNGRARVQITDVRGRTLLDISEPTHTGSIVWNASAVPIGVCFVTVTIGERSETATVVTRL